MLWIGLLMFIGGLAASNPPAIFTGFLMSVVGYFRRRSDQEKKRKSLEWLKQAKQYYENRSKEIVPVELEYHLLVRAFACICAFSYFPRKEEGFEQISLFMKSLDFNEEVFRNAPAYLPKDFIFQSYEADFANQDISQTEYSLSLVARISKKDPEDLANIKSLITDWLKCREPEDRIKSKMLAYAEKELVVTS